MRVDASVAVFIKYAALTEMKFNLRFTVRAFLLSVKSKIIVLYVKWMHTFVTTYSYESDLA